MKLRPLRAGAVYHLTGPLVGAKQEKFDVYWFIGPLCILRHVLTFDLTNKILMHVTKNVV